MAMSYTGKQGGPKDPEEERKQAESTSPQPRDYARTYQQPSAKPGQQTPMPWAPPDNPAIGGGGMDSPTPWMQTLSGPRGPQAPAPSVEGGDAAPQAMQPNWAALQARFGGGGDAQAGPVMRPQGMPVFAGIQRGGGAPGGPAGASNPWLQQLLQAFGQRMAQRRHAGMQRGFGGGGPMGGPGGY